MNDGRSGPVKASASWWLRPSGGGGSTLAVRSPIPAPLAERAKRARAGLEVGAGARFEVALALAAANPRARWIVSDVDARVLDAPAPLEARVLDVHAPPIEDLAEVDLVYAVRIPEELQLAAARLADRLGADLAIRPLKDEWADLGPRRFVAWPDGWRFIERKA